MAVSEEEFNKKLKGTKMFSIFVSCIYAILFILYCVDKSYFSAVICLICIAAFLSFFFLTKKRSIAGPIIGIILGCLYIINFLWAKAAISLILGIVIIIDCVVMIKYLRQDNSKISEDETANVEANTTEINNNESSNNEENNQ